MTLGLYTFALDTLPFDATSRDTGWRWPSQDRAGAPPAYQYVGPGADTLTLDGSLAPEITGGPVELDTLRKMAGEGRAWMLLDGRGRNRGTWIITDVRERRSHLLADGTPRRIEFTVSLTRYPDGDIEGRGDLMDSLPGRLGPAASPDVIPDATRRAGGLIGAASDLWSLFR
jgi:phage protein U